MKKLCIVVLLLLTAILISGCVSEETAPTTPILTPTPIVTPTSNAQGQVASIAPTPDSEETTPTKETQEGVTPTIEKAGSTVDNDPVVIDDGNGTIDVGDVINDEDNATDDIINDEDDTTDDDDGFTTSPPSTPIITTTPTPTPTPIITTTPTLIPTPKATQGAVPPGAVQNTFTNSIGMEFVLISAGEFDMGSPEYSDEGPVHRVKLANAFYMGKYKVTQKQWRDIMGTSPSYFKGDNLPVEQVSWNDVQEFIKKLNEKEGTNKYRLPSEAEWEYAVRAGTITRYSFGDDESKLGNYAWYYDNSGMKTHEVGKKKPNPWGLYDMHGNVDEWVQDIYHNNYNAAPTDGSAWEGDGSDRVVRGGHWGSPARECRSADRGYSAGDRPGNVYVGFRLLRDLSPIITTTPPLTPTHTVTPTTSNAQGHVTAITRIGDCQWGIYMEATGLMPGGRVRVSDIDFEYYDCQTGVKTMRSWGPLYIGAADSAGRFAFSYLHKDYGTYHYLVEDDAGNRAWINLSYGRV